METAPRSSIINWYQIYYIIDSFYLKTWNVNYLFYFPTLISYLHLRLDLLKSLFFSVFLYFLQILLFFRNFDSCSLTFLNVIKHRHLCLASLEGTCIKESTKLFNIQTWASLMSILKPINVLTLILIGCSWLQFRSTRWEGHLVLQAPTDRRSRDNSAHSAAGRVDRAA